MTLAKLLHLLTMLTKLMCTLKVTFFMKVCPTEIKEDDSDDTPFKKGGRLVFSSLKRVPRG